MPGTQVPDFGTLPLLVGPMNTSWPRLRVPTMAQMMIIASAIRIVW
ncbi:hypothetical protein [Mesorhizobium sp.]|nr:hypothetical protein [Mesorhizobium sp.]